VSVAVPVMEVACGQYGDVVPSLVVAAKSHVYADYQHISPVTAASAAAAAVYEKPINSLKASSSSFIISLFIYVQPWA